MHFAYDDLTHDLIARTRQFLDDEVAPRVPDFASGVAQLDNHWAWSRVAALQELRTIARERGLWNLFLPGADGAGLTNLQYAPLAEMSGRIGHLAPAAMNCAAPDTGNMELLSLFASPDQRTQWLKPLLEGRIRSAFLMTEPEVASSDATNISTRIETKDGGYLINGRKWWATGAMNPDAAVFILLGRSDPEAARHEQHSMLLVPRDTPGVQIVRPLTVFGYDDREHGGHAEISLTDVWVPREALLGEEGAGFAMAQARLGPGRIHHCMRSIGVAEVALELMCERADQRRPFGGPLSDRGVVREWIAQSRIQIEQLRLLVLKTAWMIDTVGVKAAATEVAAIKVATPATVQSIVDTAIQAHGAAGVSGDFTLAKAAADIRTLRLADGPDEVHRRALGRTELRRQRDRRALLTD
ncbi:acyl-CoA dehydrogenase family protein [Ornithinimicrobium murale]|uniref:acyl-CoA dehydrogenase family protein n=1 Tax=Ornithinimicrobium murale TaxID=1050153 RepID=UPI000E0DDD7E